MGLLQRRDMDDPLATEADTLRRHSIDRPDHVAIIFQDRKITYAELNSRANQVANGLLSATHPAQRVALLTKNSDFFFEILFGAAKANAVTLPVNWRLSEREIASILLDAAADVLFIGPEFLPLLPGLRAIGSTIRDFYVLGDGDADDSYPAWRDRQSVTDPCLQIDRGSIFLQLYTSGTTGTPKGVQISHDASMRMRELEVGTGGDWTVWRPRDVAIVAMPNFHVGGTSWALQWFARGATCVVQPQVDAAAMLDAIHRYEVTHLFAVPTVLDMMLKNERCAATDFSRLKLIHYGGAPIPPTLLVQCMGAFNTQFVQYFGMTETNGVVSVLEPRDHDLSKPDLLRSCGKPYPAVDLRIIDPAGQEVAAGDVGEVCVETPCLMSGYWGQPDALANSMRGRYYRTGDAGFKNADGYLFLVDRIKDMIVSGGENIFPIDIERALHEHPAVVEAAVIGVPDPHWGEAVKAVVVVKDSSIDAAVLLEFLRERVARYKLPKSIDFVPALPRNGAGKILKRTLRDQYGNMSKTRSSSDADRC